MSNVRKSWLRAFSRAHPPLPMDRHQARDILQSCRADGSDDGNPNFAEALGVAATDPALAARLEADRALDRAIGSRLQEIPPPPFLREQVLAGVAARKSARRHRRAALLALAACVALLAVIGATWMVRAREKISFASYRQDMVGRLDGRIQLSFTGENPSDLQNWLETKRGVSGFTLPAGLQHLPGIGCRTWTWNGRPAGLICFLGNGREAVHLLVISRDAVPRAPAGGETRFEQIGGWQTASWVQGDQVFLLAGKLERAELQKLL